MNPFQPIYDLCNSGDAGEKISKLPSFPRYLDIELTNLCNFQCLMCPVGTGSMHRPAGMMDEYIFNKIIDEIKHFKTPIRFTCWGEPTLHPKFLVFLKTAKTNNIMCHLNTNGSKFSEEMIEEFINIPLDSIKISFQGIDSKSYNEMRNICFFDKLVDNIKLLYQKRGDKPLPFIHVTTTTTYETPEQIDQFYQMMKKITDLVTVGKTQMDLIDPSEVSLSNENRERLKFLKTQESLNKKHLDICSEVFDKLSINWDGIVSACCADYDNKMIVGDLRKNSIQEIWSSEKMRTYRKILAEKRYDDIELCKHCYDTMNIQMQTSSTEKHP
jgi:radical SAM protein with 4Fe4S-binding SPASM domain